jgi:two-component sensor histidine kinase
MDEKIMMKFASALSISHERVLLQELNHRINNEFFSAMNLVSLAAARSGSHEVKVALAGVTDLLHHHAELHRSLQVPQDNARIDAPIYLRKLCLAIRRSKLDHMKIDLVLAAPLSFPKIPSS